MKTRKSAFLLLLLTLSVSSFCWAQKQPSESELVIQLDGKPFQYTFKLNMTEAKVGLDLVVHGEISSGQLTVQMQGPVDNSESGLRISAKPGKKSKGKLYETIAAPGEWTIQIANDTGTGRVIVRTEKSMPIESAAKPLDLKKDTKLKGPKAEGKSKAQ